GHRPPTRLAALVEDTVAERLAQVGLKRSVVRRDEPLEPAQDAKQRLLDDILRRQDAVVRLGQPAVCPPPETRVVASEQRVARILVTGLRTGDQLQRRQRVAR